MGFRRHGAEVERLLTDDYIDTFPCGHTTWTFKTHPYMFSEFGDGHDNPAHGVSGLLITTRHTSYWLLITSHDDPGRRWNVIDNAVNSRCHPPTSTPVLQSTTPLLQSTTPHYKELLQYCSVLLCTTPILLCITKCYSSPTLYYPVLQSTTPSYKVLLQHCSALLCTTKYYLYEMSLTLRGATGVTLQHHQKLCLQRKVTVMIDPCHIWNVRWRTAIAPPSVWGYHIFLHPC